MTIDSKALTYVKVTDPNAPRTKPLSVLVAVESITASLSTEENVSGIIPLLEIHAFNAVQLAAWFIFLIRKGVTVAEIINSKILHTVLLHNLHEMGREEGTLNQLYTLLSEFAETRDLAEKAKTISVKIGGVCYSLDGQYRTGATDTSYQAERNLSIQFTHTDENLKGLYTQFGTEFLLIALEQLEKNRVNAELKANVELLNKADKALDVLVSWINKKVDSLDVILDVQQLMQFINAHHDNPPLLKALARIISTERARTLLESREAAIFHLIPYHEGMLKSELLTNVDQFEALLKLMCGKEGNYTSTRLLQLAALLGVLELTHTGALYQTLVGDILKQPVLLKDENFIDRVSMALKRGYSQSMNFNTIKEKAEEVEKQLKDSITKNLLEKNSFSQENYHAVNADWSIGHARVEFLKSIDPNILADYPMDKYAQWAYIIKQVLEKRSTAFEFDLHAILSKIALQPNSVEEVSEYERALIEILTAIDNESIRNTAISLLEQHVYRSRKNGQWIGKTYRDSSVLFMAQQYNNQGLIKWLLEEQTDYAIADELFTQANSMTELSEYLLKCPALEGPFINLLNTDTHLCRRNKYFSDIIDNDIYGLKKILQLFPKEAVKQLVLRIAKQDIQDSSGRTVLHCAIINAEEEEEEGIIDWLLETEIDVNRCDLNGRTALHWAAIKGNEEAVRQLVLFETLDLNRQDIEGKTALYYAINNGKKNIINRLLKTQKLDVNICDLKGRTALHWAAIIGDKETVRQLWRRVKQDMPDKEGRTALYWAVIKGNEEAVRQLLVWGVAKRDLNAVDSQGRTALDYVNSENIKLLFQRAAEARASAESNQHSSCHHRVQEDVDKQKKSARGFRGLWSCLFYFFHPKRPEKQHSDSLEILPLRRR
jgi:ankyrin repeat protein